jgi:hypothetical protein
MNITLSADEALIGKTRRYAKAHGKTLNGIVRDYMESLVGAQDRDEAADEFTRLALAAAGHSEARFVFDRDAAHERGNS